MSTWQRQQDLIYGMFYPAGTHKSFRDITLCFGYLVGQKVCMLGSSPGSAGLASAGC
jgi:hypothetical protein